LASRLPICREEPGSSLIEPVATKDTDSAANLAEGRLATLQPHANADVQRLHSGLAAVDPRRHLGAASFRSRRPRSHDQSPRRAAVH
jgi:hypothetical protein